MDAAGHLSRSRPLFLVRGTVPFAAFFCPKIARRAGKEGGGGGGGAATLNALGRLQLAKTTPPNLARRPQALVLTDKPAGSYFVADYSTQNNESARHATADTTPVKCRCGKWVRLVALAAFQMRLTSGMWVARIRVPASATCA
jgi:hypothetical protein